MHAARERLVYFFLPSNLEVMQFILTSKRCLRMFPSAILGMLQCLSCFVKYQHPAHMVCVQKHTPILIYLIPKYIPPACIHNPNHSTQSKSEIKAKQWWFEQTNCFAFHQYTLIYLPMEVVMAMDVVLRFVVAFLQHRNIKQTQSSLIAAIPKDYYAYHDELPFGGDSSAQRRQQNSLMWCMCTR